MPRKLRIAYLAHSLRSDWNNGNAHFLRGLLSELSAVGHMVDIFEPRDSWSYLHLLEEERAAESLQQFESIYPELQIHTYDPSAAGWERALAEVDVVILHEWNEPALALDLLSLRDRLGFRLLFHDTHHRASSSPEQIRNFGVESFDGVIAFGETLRAIYRDRLGIARVWTLHEAADTRVFRPGGNEHKAVDVVWVGNWGDEERSREIGEFLLAPAAQLPQYRFAIYGVRYPPDGLRALQDAHVRYGGYLPNLAAPASYAAARLTVHIPRQQYARAMTGIPTIRMFEALACGIPLISAPWQDTELLFREGDYLKVRSTAEMKQAMCALLDDPAAARLQAARGLETVLARHTCRHRAEELSAICQELVH